jgi:type II secretory pathway component PulL
MGKSLFIDIKDSGLSTHIFEVRGNKWNLKESRNFPLSGKYDFNADEIFVESIENAYLSLPLSFLNFRIIDLPFSDKDRIREILPFELDGMILGGPENVIFDDIIIGASDGKHQVLAVYLEKHVLKEILGKLKSHNVDPVCVTSIELKNSVGNLTPAKLLSPVALKDEDRIALAVEEMKAPTINLRRDEFSYTRDIEKTNKSLKITASLLIFIALVFASDVLLKVISARHEIASLRNEMRKEYREIFPGEKNIMNELYQLKSHMKELQDKKDVFVGVNPLALLSKLSSIDMQGAVINEVTVDRDNISLKGEAHSLSDIQKFQDKLKQAFDGVDISDSRASAQGRMMFTITAREKRG